MYLAENLKFLREQNGKTQGELAVLFGIEQKTISSWECGSRKPPIGTIVSLAKLYRVSLDDLVLTDMRPPIPVYALNLAYLRKKHGMTQQEISELLGYSGKQGYNAIETGKVKPTIDTLLKKHRQEQFSELSEHCLVLRGHTQRQNWRSRLLFLQ